MKIVHLEEILRNIGKMMEYRYFRVCLETQVNYFDILKKNPKNTYVYSRKTRKISKINIHYKESNSSDFVLPRTISNLFLILLAHLPPSQTHLEDPAT